MRQYRTRIKSRACENFGAVDYTITDTITERDGGLFVESRAQGVCEGDHVDSRSTKFYPGASIDRAESYRLSNGWTKIS